MSKLFSFNTGLILIALLLMLLFLPLFTGIKEMHWPLVISKKIHCQIKKLFWKEKLKIHWWRCISAWVQILYDISKPFCSGKTHVLWLQLVCDGN